ncbi:GNAT family N-acetyltransferase [Streptococcus sp. DD12]|uniref:GNAT family N-acetyltransferase n=1 Tax=Streptococcus sp. DD12 TaxID=1777880 RepID=UPI000795CE4C|nr:GNAT family N-acetyltransferase [Streptococcus sp. DD12]KXT75549.1 putative arylalkylamine n-acetyltransferase [Streptococcus sp. DD12]
MKIRRVTMADLAAIMLIERENFSPKEAASPQAMRRRLDLSPETQLVIEEETSQTLLGYVSSLPCPTDRLTDDLFDATSIVPEAPYLAVLSLSILSDCQGQGLGSLLLAALKEVALEQGRRGITLTCHETLVTYYEANGFVDSGYSQSNHGGSSWIDMLWQA